MKRTKRYGGFLVGDRVKSKSRHFTLVGDIVALKDGMCIVDWEDVVGNTIRIPLYPKDLVNLTRQEEEVQDKFPRPVSPAGNPSIEEMEKGLYQRMEKNLNGQQIEEYVYDPNKKVSLGEELAKADQTRRNLIKALNERDFDTANKITKDNHLNCIFSPKSYDSDNSQKDLSKETEQPSVGTTQKNEKPEEIPDFIIGTIEERERKLEEAAKKRIEAEKQGKQKDDAEYTVTYEPSLEDMLLYLIHQGYGDIINTFHRGCSDIDFKDKIKAFYYSKIITEPFRSINKNQTMNFLFKKSNQPIEKLPDNIEEPKEPEVIEFEKPLSEEAKRLKEIAENMQDRINLEKGNEVLVKAKQKAEYEQLAEDLAFLKDFGYGIRVLDDEMLVGGLNIRHTHEDIYTVSKYSYKNWPYNSDETPTEEVIICASKELLVKFLVAYKSYNWEKAIELYQTL